MNEEYEGLRKKLVLMKVVIEAECFDLARYWLGKINTNFGELEIAKQAHVTIKLLLKDRNYDLALWAIDEMLEEIENIESMGELLSE